jgi:hypothetical protein
MSEHYSIRFTVENIKGLWKVFSIVESYGRTFKNFVGEARTKSEAEAIAAKAKTAT